MVLAGRAGTAVQVRKQKKIYDKRHIEDKKNFPQYTYPSAFFITQNYLLFRLREPARF